MYNALSLIDDALKPEVGASAVPGVNSGAHPRRRLLSGFQGLCGCTIQSKLPACCSAELGSISPIRTQFGPVSHDSSGPNRC
jgi:hypothetical protein